MIYQDKFDHWLSSQDLVARPAQNLFLVGDEFVLIEDSLAKIKNKFKQIGSDFQYFYPEKGFDYVFLEQSSVSGLFEGGHCFVLRLNSLSLTNKQLGMIESFLKNNQNHQVVFLYSDYRASDKNNSLVKLFENYGQVIRHMKIKPEQFSLWVKNRIQSEGIRISDRSSDLISHYCFSNPAAVLQIIQKIKLLNQNEVSETQMLDLMDENNLCSVFDFIDSLYHKDSEASLKKLHVLIRGGEVPIKILFLLDKEIRMLIHFHLSEIQNQSIGIRQDYVYPAKKTQISRYLRYTPLRDLIAASLLSGKVDRAMKGLNNASAMNDLNHLVRLLTH